jgi:protein SCO1/2
MLGSEYQVVTISFDNSDEPQAAQRKKDNFTGRIKLGEKAKYWQYLTTDSATIDKITDAAGFKFKREGNDFIHAAAILVVSSDGKITRYLHGTKFLPFDLRMAVTEASHGQSSPTINKVLEYCFSYDAVGKRYVLDVTQVSATIIIAIALFIFGFLAFGKSRKRRRWPAPAEAEKEA